MLHPVSSDKNLVEFCYRVETTDPHEIIDIACAEAHHHRRANRAITGAMDFRSGSKGRRYCDDLRCLVGVMLNGRVPKGANAEFRKAIAPLVRQVLKAGWRIGDLALEFADST